MKRSLFFLLILILYSSCISEGLIAPQVSININEFDLASLPDVDPYFVNKTDLEAYVKFKKLESIGKGKILEVKDIKEIYSESGDVTMYVVTYMNGWDVISADKRYPMVLASSENGELEHFSGDLQEFYFDMVSEDLQFFKLYENKRILDTKTLPDESSANVEFWDAITASDDFMGSRAVDPNLPIDTTVVDLIIGHWELAGVRSETEIYEIVDHLIPVQWGQSNPYNLYCPIRTDSLHLRAPAGCVALAGSQTLMYLQNLWDMDIDVPYTAVIDGYVGHYDIQFSDFGTQLWSNLHYNYNDAAKLISYVGFLVGVNYGNNGSSAYTEDLVDKVFKPNGINCSYGDYNASLVKSSLSDGLPVIVSAHTGLIGEGHSFVVDGYTSYRTKYTYTYNWVYNDPDMDIPVGHVPSKVEISYTSPYIEKIKINWGWANRYHNNDTWYTPVEDWLTVHDDEEYIFDYRKRMIYGFSKN